VQDTGANAIIIDPGENGTELISRISEHKLNLTGILCTHAHYDHITSASEILRLFPVKFYLHKDDFKLLSQANFYKMIFGGEQFINTPKEIIDLSLHPTIMGLIDFPIFITHAPGHTEGGVYIQIGQSLFTGDNILSYKIGRSDLPGGDSIKLIKSIELLMLFHGELILYPGHGKPMALNTVKTRLLMDI
jgi:glyoxylase-like metal-dependent hydrolase (beta-lactamase superfamily II)